MKSYVIRQGDYLAKIALRFGIAADEIWKHPKNSELRAKRKPNLLVPGDVLFVPEPARPSLPFRCGTTNRYKADVPKVPVRVTFQVGGKAIANEPYEVEGLAAPQTGESDASGKVTLQVPAHVREVRVRFTKMGMVFPVMIGDMEPIDEPSGVRKRLEHLGYMQGLEMFDADKRLRIALASFQRATGLHVSEEADEATKEALVSAHGS
ncbi:LysM peptidoglycan-binding domain-containing protein [Polyangium fumosum]|uniref:LysM peptidoglycan-binding domain-containing protein n=1 Tax=Polyangium fumosum TaxID=889272 RepID=A0A4U1JH86_9BACT|nr:LysM domain-containing protein [Polyangium fumosum]TKD11750.1 LysM peptidoglycan-binding domain-containing protein [Polyangium fumosum]